MDTSVALFCIVLLLIAIYAMGLFTYANKFNVKGRTAIVTGGSQGLGLAIAKQLASKGADVVIVARDSFKLQKAVEEISSCATLKQRFHHLSYDLCSPESAPKIISEVTTWNNGRTPDILFCCAGFCEPGFFTTSSIETLRSQMDTIYWSSAYMAHAILNCWIHPTNSSSPNLSESLQNDNITRHIVFTSSVVAFIPMAGYAPYSPAKAAMRALADTLNQEVAVYNGAMQQDRTSTSSEIKIHTIFPMGILSPGYENEQKIKPKLTMQLEKDDKPQTPEEVARIAIARLEAGDNMITTQFIGHILRGAGIGSSVRNGLLDIFWNLLGSIAMLFIVPDFISKCSNWGKEGGMAQAR
jgi:3-dehydrosphinganine reductase